MTWIKRKWQQLKQQFQPKKSVTKPQNRPIKKSVSKQKITPNVIAKSTPQKAKQQALQVDKNLSKKNIPIAKGKDVKSISPPSSTPSVGWKPNNSTPPKGRSKNKGKGMRL